MWNCVCDCGETRIVGGYPLTTGASRSCGCLKREESAERAKRLKLLYKHGGSRTAEYQVWNALKQRCENPAHANYAAYGGRGITVCERWRDSFEAFLADMGPRPSRKHSIDRIDNAGNYEPGNCRWATVSEQARNRRSNRILSFRGETLTLVEWSERTGLSMNVLKTRVKQGWSVERVLTQPHQLRRKPTRPPRAPA